MTELPPFVSRIAALALLLGLVLLIAAFGVLPVLDRVRTTDEALELDREMVARLSHSLANRGSYGARLGALREQIADSGLYVRADTEPLAAAAVQEQLKRAVSRHGGELRSVQSLPSQPDEGLTRVSLRVVMTGLLDPVVRVLHELETGEPYLFADNLQIQSTTRRRRLQGENPTITLSIRFDLYGYLPPEVEK